MRPVASCGIEAGGLAQRDGDRRRRDAQPPFVLAASGGDDGTGPGRPPRRGLARDRLHHQHAGPGGGVGQQLRQQRRAGVVGEFVGDVAEQQRRRQPRPALAPIARPPGVVADRSAPGRAVETEARGSVARASSTAHGWVSKPLTDEPAPASHAQAAPAAPVPQPRSSDAHRSLRRREMADDVRGRQEPPWRVVERVGGPLAGRVERAPAAQTRSPFDVGGRQRAQGARHLGRRHIAQVPRLEVGDPRVERADGGRRHRVAAGQGP